MYHVVLTNRYLTSRVIPLIAVGAVALCAALVMIVVSVMSGFLDMVRDSGRTLMGDVVIELAVEGIPYYEDLIKRIEALDESEAASPLVDSFGMLQMPYPQGDNKQSEYVQFWGIEPESFARVTGYADTLYWRELDDQERRTAPQWDLRRQLTPQVLKDGLTLHDSRSDRPGIVLGMHVSKANERMPEGGYHPMGDGYWWMPAFDVTLVTIPTRTIGGQVEPESFIFPVVNEFVSGVFQIDDVRVKIPLEVGQRMLHLDEAELVDPDDPFTVIGTDPARVSKILIRAADGVSPNQLRDRVIRLYDEWVMEYAERDDLIVTPPTREFGLSIRTWEQVQARFIGPVEKERDLMRILFSIVYVVCAALVLTIFWAIVHEKTRDIGILRSVGCSRIGISLIFLRYGLVIGVLGSVLGLILAFIIVRNVNTIHDAIGRDAPVWSWVTAFGFAAVSLMMTILATRREHMLPVVLWSLGTIAMFGLGIILLFHRGTLVWDPTVYYFDAIPNTLDVPNAIVTIIGAILFSVLGAFIPAAKAADTDPVEALRYE
ncbi:MAG: ABC transporter permease [Phycisphaerales bacterium]|nr:MAG: ABC transporter permease [Phycisphaerales bacterium]